MAEYSQDTLQLESLTNETNIVDQVDSKKLEDLENKLCGLIDADEQSMSDWLKKYQEYLNLAMQVRMNKTFPWRNAANVKYPLLTIAALQFHARAYPAIVNPKGLVRGKVIGYDPSGEKAKRAERVGKHMTYQCLCKIPDWEDNMDKLLLSLPIAGCLFKKVVWDGFEQQACSDLILPTEIIVNYWAKSIESARRITHKLCLFKDDITERIRDGYYRDVELSSPQMRGKDKNMDKREGRNFQGDDDALPYEICEVYTFLDLDEDDYAEPYVVTLERQNRKILRIAPNFDMGGIRKNAKNEVVRIKAKQNIVKYDFIPSPDGGLLGVGFGLLLGSLNETANTAINQLLDQGTMYTTGGGFISKGIRIKSGRTEFEPNEWKVVQITGDDLRKGIVPLPVKEPSNVLFQMLQALVASGKEIIAISEISTGKLPGQNTPATTTMTSVEEGMKLFTAIYKRIHRSLTKEYKLLFKINAQHLTDEEYFQVLDPLNDNPKMQVVSKNDYNIEDVDVFPESDPNAASDALRLVKAEQVLQLIPLGAVDPRVAGQRILEAMDIPNPQELQPKPQPSPEQMKMEMEGKMKQQEAQMKAQESQMMAMLAQREHEMKMQIEQAKLSQKAMELKLREMDFMMESRFKIASKQQDLTAKQAEHQLKLAQQAEQGALKNQQIREQQNAKAKKDSQGTK